MAHFTRQQRNEFYVTALMKMATARTRITLKVALWLCATAALMGSFAVLAYFPPFMSDYLQTIALSYDNSNNPQHGLETKALLTCQNKTMPILSINEVRRLLQEWNLTAVNSKKRFTYIGRQLYQHAFQTNQSLLTVQVGGMDGKSNDPMHEMMMRTNELPSLSNWFPVVLEPVPVNFQALTETYHNISRDNGLACSFLEQAAISYTTTQTSTCSFCRFNTSQQDPKCKAYSKWVQFQLGTLDCKYSREYFRDNFERCIAQDSIDCGSIKYFLNKNKLPSDSIAILQVDIEGYENVLLAGLFQELPDDFLPPIIHFEHKVMFKYDRKNGTTTRVKDIVKVLERLGYTISDEGDDYLAIRVASEH